VDAAALAEWQKDPNWQSDEEVAYHEAGHAVVAHFLGGHIKDMTLDAIEYEGGVQRGLTRYWLDGKPLERFEKELQTAPAGWIATKIAFNSTFGRADDSRAVTRLLNEYGHGWTPELRREWRKRGLAGALAILDVRWPAVGTLASALLERRTLSGPEIHRIIDEALA
jgi:hypothetical protein